MGGDCWRQLRTQRPAILLGTFALAIASCTTAFAEEWSLLSIFTEQEALPSQEDGAILAARTDAISLAQFAPSWRNPGEESVFTNFGLEYRYSRGTRFRVDGCNVRGAFDHDLIRRSNHGDNRFNNEAVAIGVSGETCF